MWHISISAVATDGGDSEVASRCTHRPPCNIAAWKRMMKMSSIAAAAAAAAATRTYLGRGCLLLGAQSRGTIGEAASRTTRVSADI